MVGLSDDPAAPCREGRAVDTNVSITVIAAAHCVNNLLQVTAQYASTLYATEYPVETVN